MDAFWEDIAAELRDNGLEASPTTEGVQIWLPRQDHFHQAAIWSILAGITSALAGPLLSLLLPTVLLYALMFAAFSLTAVGMLLLLGLALADLVWWLGLPVMRRAHSHRLTLTHAAVTVRGRSYPLEDIDRVDIQRTWGQHQLLLWVSGKKSILTSSPDVSHLRPLHALILEQRSIRRESLERGGHDLRLPASPPMDLLSLGKH